MKPEDLIKSFDFLINSLIEWSTAVRHPVRTALKITASPENPSEVFRSATKLWFIAFLITTIIQIPLYQLNGISWSNVGFHLSTGLILFSMLLNANLAIYVAFIFFRTGVIFADLYVFYTVLVAIFSPFFAVLGYPIVLRLVTTLKMLKASEMELTEIAVEFFRSMQPGSSSPLFEAYQAVSTSITGLIAFGMFACLVHTLSAKSGVAKSRLIDAFAFGLVVISTLPALILLVLYYFALYAFL